MPTKRTAALVHSLLLLWMLTAAAESYDGLCEEPNSHLYCTCDFRRDDDISVVCYVTSVPKQGDEVWKELTDIPHVTKLQLNSVVHPERPIRLSYIPIESLRTMEKLKILAIQQGILGQLQTGSVHGLGNLEELRLDGNEITSLQKKAVSDMPLLKTLSLSGNHLQEVLADSLSGLGELEDLFLNNNNISRIESCAFCDLQNLKVLDLVSNQITDLTEYTFRGLRYLKRLDLYKNRIRILNDKVFHALPKLIELDLSHNLIDHVFSRAFQGLRKLQVLKLNSNRIRVLPDLVFLPLHNVRSLDLSNNVLETLQVEVVDNIANLTNRDISLAFKANPLVCDCRLNWVKTYLNFNNSHLFTRELRELRCSDPEESTDSIKRTFHVVHTMDTLCDSKKPTAKPATQFSNVFSSPVPVTQPVELVKYDISETNPTEASAIHRSVEAASAEDTKSESSVGSASGRLAVNLVVIFGVVYVARLGVQYS